MTICRWTAPRQCLAPDEAVIFTKILPNFYRNRTFVWDNELKRTLRAWLRRSIDRESGDSDEEESADCRDG